MNQAWLQVAGLVFDILGVGLIAWEWILAQRAERGLRALEQEREQAQKSLDELRATGALGPDSLQPFITALHDSDRRLVEHRRRVMRRWFEHRRYRAIYAGMLLVLVGFILQLMGTWPGCCTGLGVRPAG
jgi:hypothetical protein